MSEEALGFVLSDVGRLLRRRFDQYARTLGVTRPQWQVLMALSRREGCNQGALAARLELEPITVCRMVDRLEEAGLVERRTDPADRRAWLVFLSDDARRLLDDLQEVGSRALEEALAGVDLDDRARLAGMLERILSNLAEARDAVPPDEA